MGFNEISTLKIRLELIDLGANCLKSDDEGNSCLNVLVTHLKSNYAPAKTTNQLHYRSLLKFTNRIATKCNEDQRANFEKYIDECRSNGFNVLVLKNNVKNVFK